jgi:hypothetical protein
VGARGVEPEDGGRRREAGAIDGEFDPVLNGGVFGLAGAPDVTFVDEVFEDAPAIEIEIVFRAQRLANQPEPGIVTRVMDATSPLIGDGRLEQAGVTVEIGYLSEPDATPEFAVEITYEGLYELAESSLADGASHLLDEHFGALGGWIAATLVRLGDLGLAYLPSDDDEDGSTD